MNHSVPISFDANSDALAAAYDELPLWSAPFGLLLLDCVPLSRGIAVLDVGCGTGFPLLELAQRLGDGGVAIGLDPWQAALKRAREKARFYGLQNVHFVAGDAACLPFPDASFQLVTSNLGVNNITEREKGVGECFRVLKPGGSLALTTNFNGHMAEFYDVFRRTLEQTGLGEYLPALEKHCAHRSDKESICALLEAAGFRIVQVRTHNFTMRFVDGSALLSHYFIRLGFLQGWREIVEEDNANMFFPQLEANLNTQAARQGELTLTVPFGYIEGRKP